MAGPSEDSLRRLLEETTLLAAITDARDRIIYANGALARLVGKHPGDVVGSRWTGTFGSSSADDKFMNDLRQGRVTSTYEGRICSVDGPRIIAWTNTLISGPAGCVAVASLGEDVTARRHAEEELLAVQAERLRLQQAILAAETAERARLAEALHDDTIQVITAALLNLDRMTCDNLDGMRRQTAEALTSALERARRLLFELRPPALDRGGLRAAIGDLGRQAAQEAGWHFEMDVLAARFPRPIEELVFRTAREAILNVRRHARASVVCVRAWEADGMLLCEITDDGDGFDVEAVGERPEAALHLGLAAMGERIRLARGTVDIRSTSGHGTTVRMAVPTGPESPLLMAQQSAAAAATHG